jgi:glutamine amidotransferase
MCRFFIYKGREAYMSDLLMKSDQSLIMQSYKARERKEPLNGDGFGVGWYNHDVDPTPCVFTSTQPAWSNRNLFRLSEKIRSNCFFAHVRAASPGSFVSEFNCHPFQYEQFLWMHNGRIAEFSKLKRRMRESLNDEYYNSIQGTTDSEHAFALFLNILGERINDYTLDDLKNALLETIKQITDWQREAGIEHPSYLNFAVSDGFDIVASRFVSNLEYNPPTLYLSAGERIEVKDGNYRMAPVHKHPNTAVIASEPLTSEREDWHAVEPNHIVTINAEMHIHQTQIPGDLGSSK